MLSWRHDAGVHSDLAFLQKLKEKEEISFKQFWSAWAVQVTESSGMKREVVKDDWRSLGTDRENNGLTRMTEVMEG